jgi:hypothetical protein
MYTLDSQTKQIILDTLMTQSAAFELIEELSYANSLLYKSEPDSESTYGKAVNNVKYSDLLNQLFASDVQSVSRPEELSRFVEEIHNWLKDIEPVRYTVAFKPGMEFTKNMYKWTKENISGQHLIEIETKSEIIGGVIISANGRYHDFSLEKIINQYFSLNKDAILSILQK